MSNKHTDDLFSADLFGEENVEQNEVQVQPSEQADEKQTSEAEKPEKTSNEPSETKE